MIHVEKPGRTGKTQRAFTLLETLVVIGVIAVLVALIVPVFKRVHMQRTHAQCLAQIRASAMAVFARASDNGGVFKTWARGSESTGQLIWGADLFNRGYVDSKAILRCPGAECRYGLDDGAWYHNTYGVNMLKADGLPDIAAGAAQNYELRLSQVQDPSRHVFLVDSATRAFIPDKPGVRSQTFRANMEKLTDGIHLRHGGRANVVHLDGHMESLDRERANDLFKEDIIYDPDG